MFTQITYDESCKLIKSRVRTSGWNDLIRKQWKISQPNGSKFIFLGFYFGMFKVLAFPQAVWMALWKAKAFFTEELNWLEKKIMRGVSHLTVGGQVLIEDASGIFASALDANYIIYIKAFSLPAFLRNSPSFGRGFFWVFGWLGITPFFTSLCLQ